MSEYWYLVAKNKKEKKAIILYLGTSIEYDEQVVKRINSRLEEMDENLEELANIFDKKITDITLEDVEKILRVVKDLDDFKYKNSLLSYGNLLGTMYVFGAVRLFELNDAEIEVISDYSEKYSTIEEDLKKEGYEVWWW